jgi:acyl-CoA synthetase (AMP-forming)/AMP-acid ligase II
VKEYKLQTVATAFEDAARAWPEHPFLSVLPETAGICGIPAGERSYATVLQSCLEKRAAYSRAGYQTGHRVGLMLGNRPSFFAHWLALNALGVSVVPLSAELRAADLEYQVRHSEIVLAVAPASRHDELEALGVPAVTEEAAPPEAPLDPLGAIPDETAECALLYTSGTTGKPKGCILSNRYYLMAGEWYASLGGLAELRPGRERMLTPLPLVHMNAIAFSATAMILTGGCLVMLDRFHAATWWQSVRESRATVVHYLGVMPSILMKAAPSADDRRHSVRFGFGAGVDRRLHAPFEERFGFPLLEGWAMTETGPGAVIIANREPRNVGTNCFGHEENGVEVRIEGDPGELLVRRAGADPKLGFFSGYLKDREATDEAWAGGWFHTGDIVRRGPDGQLHFVDRSKNVIRRSGENISAVEVESVLNQHPDVKASAVAPTPDEVRGDEVLACIVLNQDVEDRRAMAADLVRFSLEKLAYFKAPGYVAFVDELPLTSSQKIQRGDLRKLAQSLPGQAHCVDTRHLKKRS